MQEGNPMKESMNGSKRTFVLGMITGIAIVVVLGGVYMLGQKSSGANGGAVANVIGNQPAANQPTQPSGPEGDVTKIAPVSKDDHIRGDANAKITLIEYSDFECPFCGRFRPTLDQVLAEYKGTVRLVYRQFPLRSIHPQAQKAAEASECAAEQGKFWEMHDKLFDLNIAQTFTLDNIKKAAADIKLNTSKFNDCLDNGRMAAVVEADYQDGIAGGVSGTPGTFVNSQYVAGALPYEQVKAVIDSLL